MGQKINLGKERIGETRTMKCGLKCTIVEYKMSRKIVVRFENGLLKKGTYSKFLAGTLTPILSEHQTTNEERIGKKAVMRCGEECTIIQSINSSNIYVKFKSGLVKHATYKAFVKGHIENKERNQPFKDKDKEFFNPLCGLKYKIIGKDEKTRYYKIMFEDGTVKSSGVTQIYKGTSLHPGFNKMGSMVNFKGYSGKRVKIGKRYYWNVENVGLITPQQIIKDLL